jgi:hypothetical protein
MPESRDKLSHVGVIDGSERQDFSSKGSMHKGAVAKCSVPKATCRRAPCTPATRLRAECLRSIGCGLRGRFFSSGGIFTKKFPMLVGHDGLCWRMMAHWAEDLSVVEADCTENVLGAPRCPNSRGSHGPWPAKGFRTGGEFGVEGSLDIAGGAKTASTA